MRPQDPSRQGRLRRRGRPGHGGFWFWLAATVLKPLLWTISRRDWRGVTNVPSGGVIIAANHVSWLDPVTFAHFVHDGLRRYPRYLAKVELFRIPLVGHVLYGTGQIPVYRRSKDAAQALRDAVAAVRAGECVVIYPEGTCTRDPDGWPMAGKTGVARLALTTGCPVVPVAQWGPQQILPYGKKRPRFWPRRTVQVLAGPPVDLSDLAGAEQTPDILRTATDRVMNAVRDLLGEVRGEQPPAEPYHWHPGDQSSSRQAAP